MSGVYVALGDSMSIDAYAGGAGRGAASLLFRNRDVDFPDWSGRDLAGSGFTAQLLASDGATSADVVREQLPMVSEDPTLVTITMGGNDLMSVYGDTAAARAAVDVAAAATETVLRRLPPGVDRRVVITTVYDPSDGTGHVPTAALPPWPEGSAAVRALNAELSRLADRYGAVVADVHATFLGHGVASGDPAQPDPRPANGDLWYCGLIEPNAWGAHHIRTVWWQALLDSGWTPQHA
jgi:lysophospholipase L1-like esterase